MDTPSRPTWFLAPGGRPVPASSRCVPEGCRYQCREGDAAWIPIGADAVDEPEPLFRPIALALLAEGEARCIRCHLVRPMDVPRCPSCGDVEYSLAPARVPKSRRRREGPR